ncbi:MAG: serine/threonine-protein kinase [Polyangia bacterium]
MDCPSESQLQALVEGRIDASALDVLVEHLDGCERCRKLVGAVHSVRDDDRIGRYVLRRAIGSGAMGVVYEALDPDLDRVVALKLLREDLRGLQPRLVAEARAMARLSSPHVVAVHDIGTHAERVYIVMALVDGPSLRAWLGATPRPWREVLDVLIAAGAGLATAHESELVHRDFKPENVFVARDGRVLIGDFGLAAQVASSSASEGSPAYMAPEQLRGEPPDARSDQYAFCRTLDDALDDDAPRWLRRLLARGLEPEPPRRHPSMRALLAKIGERRRRRSRAGVAAALSAFALVGGATYWAGSRHHRFEACRAAVSSPWTRAAASSVREAVLREGGALGSATWSRVEQQLGTYASTLEVAQTDVCHASAQSEPLVDQKIACLADRRQLLDAVIGQLEHADVALVERATTLLSVLAPIQTCSDLSAVAAQPPTPAPGDALAVAAARRSVAAATAAIGAGRYEDGLASATASMRVAERTHDLPIQAVAALWMGIAHGRLGKLEAARAELERAASSASAGHADLLAVEAWIQLVHFVGCEGGRTDEGFRWDTYAEHALRSLPGHFALEAERLSWRSALLVAAHRDGEALETSRRQLALVETTLGTKDRLYAGALDGIAGVLADQGRSEDAIPLQERACASLEASLGSPHPQLALCLNNLGALQSNLGQHALAVSTKRRALDLFTQLPGHPAQMAMTHRNLARSLIELDQLDDATRQLDEAAHLAHGDADQHAVLLLRGEVARRAGKLTEALRLHRQLVAAVEHAPPKKQIEAWLALGETTLAARRYPETTALATRATAETARIYGANSYRLIESLRLEVEALLALGQRAAAAPLLIRATMLAATAQLAPNARQRLDALAAWK